MMQPLPENPPRRVKKRSHWFSTLVLLVGFGFLLYGVFILGESRLAQAWASYVFDRDAPAHPSAPAAEPGAPAPVIPEPAHGDWIGRLEIPRLDVSVMVREGDDDATLRIAAGHLPGTALPGEPGTVAIAGHRDTLFRALQNVRNNDVIRLETKYGTHEYRVEQIKIVNPTDTEVLRSDGEPVLSLITCYPFYYVGSAPQRFVVRAKETQEMTADAASARNVSDTPTVSKVSASKPSVSASRTISARPHQRRRLQRQRRLARAN